MKHLLFAANEIQTAGLAIAGQNLFLHTLPADVKEGIMIRDILDPADVDEEMPKWYQQTFQVIVRNPDVQAGYAIAEQIFKLLDFYHIDIDGMHINRLRPTEKPVSFPRGDGDQIETAVRFKVSYGETS